MKIVAKVVRERVPENTGPLDWDYDFTAHDWDHGGAMNPEALTKRVEWLRALADGFERGEKWVAVGSGVSGEVIDLGMWDGWPYWRPVPSVCIWSEFYGKACWFSVFALDGASNRMVPRG